MFKNKKVVFIGLVIGFIVLTIIGYALLQAYTKPKMSLVLKSNREKYFALQPGEKVIRTVSFQQGKVLVLQLDYTIKEPLDSQDMQIWISTTGPKMLHIGSNVIAGMPVPTRDSLLSEANPGSLVADIKSVPNTPGKTLRAKFTEYFREKGTFKAQAEIRVKGKTVGKSNQITLEVN